MTEEPLSKVPSEAIYQLLADLEAIERNPRYVVNMHTWVDASKTSGCQVCLGGAMLVRTLGSHEEIFDIMHDQSLGESSLSEAANAANHLRSGDLGGFLAHLTGTNSLFLHYLWPRQWVDYAENPEVFKQNLAWIAEQFEYLEENDLL